MKFFANGLIIKKQKYKEKDRIVTVLTGGNGIIQAFVRGAEDIKNPKCASTDILCYSRLTISEGKDAYYINEAKAIEQFKGLRESPESLALASYFCDILLCVCPKDSNAEEYLKLTLNSLYLLSNNKKDRALIKACFELRTMVLSGYMPDLVMCNTCGAFESKAMTFIPNSGIIVCDVCTKENDIQGITVPFTIMHALRYITYSSMDKLFSFKLSTEMLEILNKVTELYIINMTEKKYKTLDFYKALLKNYEQTL